MIQRELEIIDTDPGELVTGVVSGWGGGYHTEKNTIGNKKSIPISASDILARLKKLEGLINRDTVNFLVKGLATHLQHTDNPHNTDIDHFRTDILGLLYGEYLESGGTETYDYFISRLFEVYRIASVLDLNNGVDDTALATIAIVKKFLDDHDRNPNAHSLLFQRMVPGTPPRVMPTFALTTLMGFSKSFTMLPPSKWSYIGSDGYLYFSDSDRLPTDYTYGIPTVPIWEARTNFITSTKGFSGDSWVKKHIYVVNNMSSIDKTNTAVGIRENMDDDPQEHVLVLNNQQLEPETEYTYSVYYKPETGRYLEFRVSHPIIGKLAFSRVDTRTGEVLFTSSQFGIDLSMEVVPTAVGYSRYGFIFTSPNHTHINIEIAFYKNPVVGPHYVGTGQMLGYLDYAQLEKGVGMSPVIATTGSIVTRPSSGLRIPMDDRFDVSQGTLAVKYVPPIMHSKEGKRVLFAISGDEATGVEAYYQDSSVFYVDMYDVNLSEIVHYPMTLTPSGQTRYVGISYSEYEQILSTGSTMPQTVHTPTSRYTDINYIDIGHNGGQNFLNGYVDKIIYYKQPFNMQELMFCTGDE